VSNWEKLIDFFDKSCSPKEPNSQIAILKYTLMKEELEKDFI
jgi:hypothetical protein